MIWEDGLRLARTWNGPQGATDFIYGLSVNSPEYMVRGASRFVFIKDHLGSPQYIVDSLTGNILQELEYDEWGKVLNDSNPQFQPFGFAGGLYDAESDFLNFGARDYDPQLGRWTSKDPLLFQGGMRICMDM